MRDIYLIDFENVASEGLSGITYLSEDDQVIIFYSNNSNRISMKMHILIGKSVCKLDYFEVLVGGKNALDHQLSTWLGYLIGTGAAERNYYIVSRDMGYKHVANFWSGSAIAPSIRCIDAIKVAGKLERQKLQREAAEQAEEPAAEEAAPAEAPIPEEAPVELAPIETAETPEVPAETLPEAPVPAVTAEEEAPVPESAPEAEPQSEEKQEAQEDRIRSFHNRNRGKKSTTRSRQRTGAAQNTESKAEKQPAKQEKQEKKTETKGLEQLSALLLPYPALQESHLRQLIHDNKKQILCNTLRKQLGQEKGLALYNDIKKIAWR